MTALSDDPHERAATGWSKHRIEALTDGIYAVAMTLLVIDLKLPDAHLLHNHDDFVAALVALLPKALAWFISFFVLAIFWLGQHRGFHRLKVVDSTFVWLNIVQLCFVSLLPFSASLIGEYGGTFEAHCFYNGNMVLMASMSIAQALYVHRHPELHAHPIPRAVYLAVLFRTGALVVIAIAAMCVAYAVVPIFSTWLYMLMWPIGVASRKIIARGASIPTNPSAPHS
jgi:uncharacterized membrane protein